MAPRILKNGTPTAELYIRLKVDGVATWINLSTANVAEAARKARDLWLSIRANGGAAALGAFRPQTVRAERCCTVGEYIEAARDFSTARPKTLAQYEARLRSVVGAVLGAVKTPACFAPGSEANLAWRAKIDGTRLDRITPEAVRAWQRREIDEAEGEVARRRRLHGTASLIRNARSLFSEAIVAGVSAKLKLPNPLPFEGVTVTQTTRRFRTTVDPRKLYAQAGELDADTRCALVLLLIAGLRRGEADLLPWAHVDLQAGTITVAATEFFAPKTEESTRVVPLPRDVVEFLRELKRGAVGEFVLQGEAPSYSQTRYEYRAKAWGPLLEWLRANGLDGDNPLHALRKLSGSLIHGVAGLEAARRHLGHRSIATTAASYLRESAAVVDLSATSAERSGKKKAF